MPEVDHDTTVEEVQPDAGRLVEGLRDTGYDFSTAVADVIDNSIAAEATRVDVSVNMDLAGQISVTIADNGIGMDRTELINAMKYGSAARLNPNSLGKFGLGLKTASTAFCRRLSVISRDRGEKDYLKATWDLDHIVKHNKWELLLSRPNEDETDLLSHVADTGSGTLVVWNKVDRLMPRPYKNPSGKDARRALEKIVTALEADVGMIFHRFLDHDFPAAPYFELRIDGRRILPWNPFCEAETETVVFGDDEASAVLPDETEIPIVIKAYVLPRDEDFSSREAAKRARISNDLQGIYVFRENRLIHHGGYFGIISKEPHRNLLRIEFSFDHRLDDAFSIDVKKSRITPDPGMIDFLREDFLPVPLRAAEQRRRKGQIEAGVIAAAGAHHSSNVSIGDKEMSVRRAEVEVKDAAKGEVEVRNRQGKLRITMPVRDADKPGEFNVQPVRGIESGLLWEPVLIHGENTTHHGVAINTEHPYYQKVYVPNLSENVLVQGMDSLLWALCEAELGTLDDATVDHFMDLRFEVSQVLKKLVKDLPEPDYDALSSDADD